MAPFATSVAGRDDLASTVAFDVWWAGRQKANRFEVERIPFAALDDWRFDPESGNLGHTSGRFFTIEGLHVAADGAQGAATWHQPIIHQPEIGILGILAQRFDGELHFLMQAKMEPGNINTLQLSPTIQATRSNYTRVHRGGTTRYLEFFRGPGRGRVLVDVLQSEQGSWFWHKHNRNIVVEATGDVPEHEDFHWVSLHQLRRLLRTDNLVNMDARTVLSCMPLAPSGGPGEGAVRAADDPFTAALLRSYGTCPRNGTDPGPPLHTTTELLSWFTEMKTRSEWRTRLVPLSGVGTWTRTDDEITSTDGSGTFRIIGARVKAANREVTSWTQPLLAPLEQGRAAFLARAVDGVLHLLVKAQPEPGLLDTVELAPTVQLPAAGAGGRPVPFRTEVTGADPDRVRFDTVLSEEGGRFHHAQTRYQIIEAPQDFPLDVPEGFCWMTVRQLMELLRHGHYLNVEARSLLACLHSLW
ncbi:NDP-hexose 2,3-dehydratase family protein [Streptomyces sulfonofaciens]|nr:NDP-hexose 2,3-dehydratase family protein [Streptomyces sulfonofaciens]